MRDTKTAFLRSLTYDLHGIRRGLASVVFVVCLLSCFGATKADTQEETSKSLAAEKDEKNVEKKQAKKKSPRLVRLSKEHDVWIDVKNRRVIVGGVIAFRKGVLEMFACLKNTKEHESIVAVNAKAYLVHTGLLAIGAKPGKPVQYDPSYLPATGPKVKVEVVWKDKDGKEQRRLAQDMIRNVRTQKMMKHDWVFAGSYFWTDEETGKKYYQAEGGELICVSNFSTATLDLPVESSQSNGQLLFEAATERIPDLGTKVRLILTPEFKVATKVRKTDDGGAESKSAKLQAKKDDAAADGESVGNE